MNEGFLRKTQNGWADRQLSLHTILCLWGSKPTEFDIKCKIGILIVKFGEAPSAT